jgi:uncharacterized protein YecE (DUF72 family)
MKFSDNETTENSETTLIENLKTVISENDETKTIYLFFNKNLTFQNYITFKSLLNQLKNTQVLIANEEFIFN